MSAKFNERRIFNAKVLQTNQYALYKVYVDKFPIQLVSVTFVHLKVLFNRYEDC